MTRSSTAASLRIVIFESPTIKFPSPPAPIRKASPSGSQPLNSPPTGKTNSRLFVFPVGGEFKGWLPDGDAFRMGAGGEGNFIVGDSNITILSEAAVDDRVISRRLEGSLRSPGFQITNAYLHVLATGRDSRIRV